MSRLVQTTAMLLAFLVALAAAPIALACGAVWLVWRLAVYASASRGRAEIVGWSGEGDAKAIERALAFPRLSFEAHDGATREFTSRMGFNIYDDPPPQGAQPIRYHLVPRLYAEIDDRAHWFTGPVLTIAAALLGSFVASVWRLTFARWLWGG